MGLGSCSLSSGIGEGGEDVEVWVSLSFLNLGRFVDVSVLKTPSTGKSK